MKKILYLLCAVLIACSLSNCTTKEILFGGKNAETVLLFENSFAEEKLRDVICLAFWRNDDENQIASVIKTYLQEQGMYKETPDNIIYGGENYFVEYYTDNDKKKTSFIIRFGDEPNSFNGVYCITYLWDDLKTAGYIVYDNNQDGDAVYEILYDTEGEQTANISYEYFDNIPFAFIKEHEHCDEYLSLDILNRNQKFWFYNDSVVFDETGKASGMNDNIFNEFLYDEQGRLIEIREHFTEDEKIHMPDFIDLDYEVDFSGHINLDYYDNDKLKAVDYGYFYYNHGTTDAAGMIRYDEQGRMIYRSYYITHGRHFCVYLYEGESKRPWACLELCDSSYNYDDNYGYGNHTSVYIFQD